MYQGLHTAPGLLLICEAYVFPELKPPPKKKDFIFLRQMGLGLEAGDVSNGFSD